MSHLKIISVSLAFLLIAWSLLAIVENRHFYQNIGMAISWVGLGLGILVASVSVGFKRILSPPFIYAYIVFFGAMFASAMGWLPI